ncbi:MAG: hypothetical protein WAM82_05925 [Thermoanaerobaculia bacterium]
MSATLVQVVTALATLVTSLTALFTVLELRRQRMAQYQPTMAIEYQPVRIYKPAKSDYGRGFVICPEGTNPSRGHFPQGDVLLQLTNVGAGPALDVSYSWSFDELAAAECIAHVDSAAAARLVIEEETLRFQADDYTSWSSDRVQKYRLGTLLALPGKPGPSLPLPLSYLELLCMYFRAVEEPSVATMKHFPMPPLRLKVEYQDRGGEIRQISFNVALRLHFIASGGGPIPDCPGWENCAGGDLTVTAA